MRYEAFIETHFLNNSREFWDFAFIFWEMLGFIATFLFRQEKKIRQK